MRNGRLPAVDEPLVHAPEMAAADVQAEGVDDPGHQRELLGGTDRTADADGIIVAALPPGVNVLKRLGKVEVLQRVIQDDLEAGPGELGQVAAVIRASGFDDLGVKGCIIPPIRCDGAECSGHDAYILTCRPGSGRNAGCAPSAKGRRPRSTSTRCSRSRPGPRGPPASRRCRHGYCRSRRRGRWRAA